MDPFAQTADSATTIKQQQQHDRVAASGPDSAGVPAQHSLSRLQPGRAAASCVTCATLHQQHMREM